MLEISFCTLNQLFNIFFPSFSFHQSIYLSTSLLIQPPLSLSLSLYLSIYLSISLSLYLNSYLQSPFIENLEDGHTTSGRQNFHSIRVGGCSSPNVRLLDFQVLITVDIAIGHFLTANKSPDCKRREGTILKLFIKEKKTFLKHPVFPGSI